MTRSYRKLQQVGFVLAEAIISGLFLSSVQHVQFHFHSSAEFPVWSKMECEDL